MVSDCKRLLCLVLLWPVLCLQAWHVRRTTPRLPEPPGKRSGCEGQGAPLHLLVAGDSGAAGVGAGSQDEALCGQLVRRLGRHYTVHWRIWAVNGLDSPGLLQLLHDSPVTRFDVVVLSMGANDATRLCAPLQWARWQQRLADVIVARFDPLLLMHSAVPPMHACAALPQPLRWFMGRWAQRMNARLADQLGGPLGGPMGSPMGGQPGGQPGRRLDGKWDGKSGGKSIEQLSVHKADPSRRSLHWHPESTTRVGLATDGMHPSPAGYARWAEGLSQHILAAQPALERAAL